MVRKIRSCTFLRVRAIIERDFVRVIAEMNRDTGLPVPDTVGSAPRAAAGGVGPVIHDFVHRADLSPLICFVRWSLFNSETKLWEGWLLLVLAQRRICSPNDKCRYFGQMSTGYQDELRRLVARWSSLPGSARASHAVKWPPAA